MESSSILWARASTRSPQSDCSTARSAPVEINLGELFRGESESVASSEPGSALAPCSLWRLRHGLGPSAGAVSRSRLRDARPGASLLSSGCVKRAPRVVLAEPAPMQLAFVHDENESAVSGLPEGTRAAITTLSPTFSSSQPGGSWARERALCRLRTAGQRLRWCPTRHQVSSSSSSRRARAMCRRWPDAGVGSSLCDSPSCEREVSMGRRVSGASVFLSRAAEGSVEALEQALPGILRRLDRLLDDALAELATTEGLGRRGCSPDPWPGAAPCGSARGAVVGFIYFVMVDAPDKNECLWLYSTGLRRPRCVRTEDHQ